MVGNVAGNKNSVSGPRPAPSPGPALATAATAVVDTFSYENLHEQVTNIQMDSQ